MRLHVLIISFIIISGMTAILTQESNANPNKEALFPYIITFKSQKMLPPSLSNPLPELHVYLTLENPLDHADTLIQLTSPLAKEVTIVQKYKKIPIQRFFRKTEPSPNLPKVVPIHRLGLPPKYTLHLDSEDLYLCIQLSSNQEYTSLPLIFTFESGYTQTLNLNFP